MAPLQKTGVSGQRLIMGARTIIPFNGGGNWICTKPNHWIFAGTGMKKGEGIPGIAV